LADPSTTVIGDSSRPVLAWSSDHVGVCRAMERRPESRNVPPLPRCLDRVPVVVLADVADGAVRRYPVEDGEAGEGGTGPAAPATAGHLDPLRAGPFPRLAQHLAGQRAVGRQPEVRPAQPPALP